MGESRGDFVKYPRTPHLFGSTGTSDDKHLGETESNEFLTNQSLIVEEKLDGTNIGIHFRDSGELVLQCRGHLITEGMHPQYDLFKQWAAGKRKELEDMLGTQYILYGEWLYAKHSIHYRALPHFFFEFDVYCKEQKCFLSLERRLEMLERTTVQTVPVVHRGAVDKETLNSLIQSSAFDSEFDNPMTHRLDDLMEGLYLRTEMGDEVTGRAKFVRPEFTERVNLSNHWQRKRMVPNQLQDSVDIWS
jgi:hypothetical protein